MQLQQEPWKALLQLPSNIILRHFTNTAAIRSIYGCATTLDVEQGAIRTPLVYVWVISRNDFFPVLTYGESDNNPKGMLICLALDEIMLTWNGLSFWFQFLATNCLMVHFLNGPCTWVYMKFNIFLLSASFYALNRVTTFFNPLEDSLSTTLSLIFLIIHYNNHFKNIIIDEDIRPWIVRAKLAPNWFDMKFSRKKTAAKSRRASDVNGEIFSRNSRRYWWHAREWTKFDIKIHH